MSMEFTTAIEGFNQEYNLNAIGDYNKYLKGQASFSFDTEKPTTFADALDTVTKSIPLKDKDSTGMGNFMNNIETTFSNSLNAVNNAKMEADRMQEDLAMGGATSIHDAMIAAEKADLSLRMAVQVRNRILDAYTQINTMSI